MTTKDKIVELINAANVLAVPLKPSDVAYRTPVQDLGQLHNTRLTVDAAPESGYKGSVDVFYSRIELAKASTSGLMSEIPISSESIIAHLNQHPEVQLSLQDLTALDVPELQVGDTVTVQVVAKDDSLGWTGTAEVALLYGLPPNSDELFDFMNHHLPRP